MILQSARDELRNPPSVTWLTVIQESVVFLGIALLMAAIF